jgi:site-specific DNA-methyltransferase (adenine-specific)
MSRATLYLGDCREALAELPDCSVDSIVCDPPYGLSKEPDAAEVLRHWLAGDDYEHYGNGFMGKSWDSFVPGPATWREVYRVLKPGGHLVAFAGTRTQDLMGLAIRLAGFEIRDGLAWLHAQGFPKSTDISKAIDKAAGVKGELVGTKVCSSKGVAAAETRTGSAAGSYGEAREIEVRAPATDEAKQWHGWGTALKPATEPIILARKPPERSIFANVLKHDTGGLNIDACRTPGPKGDGVWGTSDKTTNSERMFNTSPTRDDYRSEQHELGRWPTNLVLTHSPDCEQVGQREMCDEASHRPKAETIAQWRCVPGCPIPSLDEQKQDASGFFPTFGFEPEIDPPFHYIAKPSKTEKNAGLDGPNAHCTVKPIGLMRWLVRLITPPGGTVLDPFTGSGTTGCAAVLEGFNFIGCELDQDYLETARDRIAHWQETTGSQPTVEVITRAGDAGQTEVAA